MFGFGDHGSLNRCHDREPTTDETSKLVRFYPLDRWTRPSRQKLQIKVSHSPEVQMDDDMVYNSWLSYSTASTMRSSFQRPRPFWLDRASLTVRQPRLDGRSSTWASLSRDLLSKLQTPLKDRVRKATGPYSKNITHIFHSRGWYCPLSCSSPGGPRRRHPLRKCRPCSLVSASSVLSRCWRRYT
jgi:hypothetical protein